MITDDDKIKLVSDRLRNIEGDIDSYIEHADAFQSKYSLDDVLPECNAIRSALIQELESLGTVWPNTP